MYREAEPSGRPDLRSAQYKHAYQRSIADPEGFWGDAATAIDWTRPPTRILDRAREPFFRWFPDGELNIC
jgi:propionyl-CoA synthetase